MFLLLVKIRGTAIGTKFAPPHGILFMAELEEKIFKGTGIKALPLLVLHRRYLFHLGAWRRKTKGIY